MGEAWLPRRRWLLASACGWTALAAAGVHRPWQTDAARSWWDAGLAATAVRPIARPGDVLFRGTRSLEGRVVRWYDGASDYTHVGVVVQPPGATLGVVHATPDERRVAIEPLDDFLRTPGITAAGLFRWAAADADSLARLQADAMASLGRAFDGAFDASDPTHLYCTELVWLLARQRGWAAAPALRPIATPLGPRHVITIEALLRELPLQPVWQAGPSQASSVSPPIV